MLEGRRGPRRRSDRRVQQLQIRRHVQTGCTGVSTGHIALGANTGVWPAMTLIDDIITLIEYCVAGSETMQGSQAGPLTVYRSRCCACPGSDWLVCTSSATRCLNDVA